MEHIDLIIEAIILGAVAYALWGQNKKLNLKLDKVLKNQEDHRVIIAEINKDVESNKSWSKSASVDIKDLQIRVNQIETDVSAFKEFKRGIENK